MPQVYLAYRGLVSIQLQRFRSKPKQEAPRAFLLHCPAPLHGFSYRGLGSGSAGIYRAVAGIHLQRFKRTKNLFYI